MIKAVRRSFGNMSFGCTSHNLDMREIFKVSKGAKIRNRYNQVPHLTQDTKKKVTNSQLDTTNGNQEVSPFPAGDHKAHINRRVQRQSVKRQFETQFFTCNEE